MEKKFEKIFEETTSLLNENVDETCGYLLFGFETNNDNVRCGFTTKGSLTGMVECLHSCMKQDPMLANIVIAAANAIAQQRMIEEQMRAEATAAAAAPAKPKRNRKKIVS